MADVSGFWSYARDDDSADGGRIQRLANLVKSEYALLTGEEIDVFLDRDDIAWGDEWRRLIDEALLGTAFFIAVITPRYFARPECRRELLTFAGHAASLGVEELLLPLLYVETSDLDANSDDEAIALVARTQYANWTDLRLEDEDSAAYRKGVHGLAQRLVEIGNRVSEQGRSALIARESADEEEQTEDDDASPGFGEILAAMEEAMPKWQETIESLAPVMVELGEAAEKSVSAIQASDERGGGFGGRIRVAAQYAEAIDAPTTRFLDLASEYASQLVTVDAGMLTLIRLASEGRQDDGERLAACQLFESVRGFAVIARENYETQKAFSQIVGETAKFSRIVRPPLRKLQAGLQRVMDGQAVIDEWVRQMDAIDLDCSDLPEQGDPGPSDGT